MKAKAKTKQSKPWMSSSSVALSTEEIKKISQSWDANTWEAYLKWFEGRRQEGLIQETEFDRQADTLTETIFESCGPQATEYLQPLCTDLLSTLPVMQAKVLAQTFLEGRTQREVAVDINRTQGWVSHLKDKAITTLKRGHIGDRLITRRIIWGKENFEEQESFNFWDQKFTALIKEQRTYRPADQAYELANHPITDLRDALLALTPLQQKVIYLFFFCERSLGQIARDFDIGINVIHQIADVAVTKVKRNLVKKSEDNFGGDNLCA